MSRGANPEVIDLEPCGGVWTTPARTTRRTPGPLTLLLLIGAVVVAVAFGAKAVDARMCPPITFEIYWNEAGVPYRRVAGRRDVWQPLTAKEIRCWLPENR